jgi:2-dehydropantoate 2-reductase
METSNAKRTRYAVLGTGAVGGYYGGLLARAGFDVHFLLHSDYEHVREHGLRIDSKHGSFLLPEVNAYAHAKDIPECDFILVSLKTTQNRLLAELLPPLLHDGATVVLMQNGLGNEEEVARIAPNHPLIGGLCFLCCNKEGPGHIHHIDYGLVTLGEHTADGSAAGVTRRLETLAGDFAAAGIMANVAEDLRTARWQKLLWNIPFNGLSVLDTTTDALMGNAATRALAGSIMSEVRAAAAACGRHIDESFLQLLLENTARMTPYQTSMKLDYDARRPLEVEAIFGNPMRAAKAAGADCGRIETLYHQLSFLDTRNRATRG